MVDVEEKIDGVEDFLEHRFPEQIRARKVFNAKKACFADWPEILEPSLKSALAESGIKKLYTHQAVAFEKISRGEDTVVVTRTASGKTLSFLLPILDAYMKSRDGFGVLFLYPTKALSRDQEGAIGRLMEAAGVKRSLGTFDGDTPREERAKIAATSDFMVSNPDMLHGGILPNHNRRWRNFLSRLRYIVVDEVHTYRGSYGSHVANIFRRLQRVCRIHGATPRFIGCSATIGNPLEHVQALFGRPFALVDGDGAPRSRRDLYLMNPAPVKGDGGNLFRRGPASVSVPLILEACKKGVRTICFCRARQEVERLYRAVWERDLLAKKFVKPYRGGLLPTERRKLEKDFLEGRTRVIISTNALELGIDIGNLDLCILSGHPGSLASFWQQAGRVGRQDRRSLIVFVARDNAVDQYLVHHPEFLSAAPVERAWLNADNPYILLQHLPCAAHEYPLCEKEPEFPTALYAQTLEVLKEEKSVVPWKENYRYAMRDYPARGVNIRGMTDYNVEIHCRGEVIGEIDPIGARGELYKDAIYQHLGRRYMSLDLDLEKKLCMVEEVDVDYFTEASWEKRLELIEVLEKGDQCGHGVVFGGLLVNKQPKLYKKVREKSFENIGYGPITLDAFEYESTGFCILPSGKWKAALDEVDRRYAGVALYGLATLLRKTAPSFCMADRSDIETDIALAEVDGRCWKSALYLYDTIEGGVGYAEKVCELLPQALGLARRVLLECECEAGCPACVPPRPPGIESEELDRLLIQSDAARACTLNLLDHLLTGKFRKPEVRWFTHLVNEATKTPVVDLEKQRDAKKIRLAMRNLKRKKERLH